jgi:hypothetical protein
VPRASGRAPDGRNDKAARRACGNESGIVRLTDDDWDDLLTRIRTGRCTPFLGAAINEGILPLGKTIAQEWAEAWKYPLDSRSDLAKVAQFVAVSRDASKPKELIIETLANSQKPIDFNDPDEPLNVLAKLPFAIYLTTNYDDLLAQAIEFHGQLSGRRPEIEICRWHDRLKVQPTHFARGSKYVVSEKTPLIYHLHGYRDVVDSLVLTEDDYLDFLVNMSKNSKFLPPRIEESMTACSVLFIGYSLADIDFRVMFRGLIGKLDRALGRKSVAVQLPYEDAHPNKSKAEEYITNYFHKITTEGVRVYWGTAKEFTGELWRRWRAFNGLTP